MKLKGTIALVTGGARRLGRQITLDLAKAGADVVINYNASNPADADATADEARAFGVRALTVRADVSDPIAVDSMLDHVEAELGPANLLVANAGVFRRTPIDTVTEQDWEDMLRLNLDVFRIPARAAGLRMKQNGNGCIIALADVAALRPWAEYMPYSVAKAGVVTLVHTLAVALAPEVRVNAIAPGPILHPTDQGDAVFDREVARTVLKRSGNARHVSDAVLFLAGNDYVTGVVLPVDGGRLLR